MSYTPTEWMSGDVITAEKLNNIENGIAHNSSDIVIVTFEDKSPYIDDSHNPVQVGELLKQGKTIFAKLKWSPSGTSSSTVQIYNTADYIYSVNRESNLIDISSIAFKFGPDHNGPTIYVSAYDDGDSITWKLVI